MAKRDFIPRQDDAALGWHDQFKNELVANGAALGFSPAEIAGVVADNAAVHADITNVSTIRAAAKAAVTKKDATRRALESRVRAYARRVKAQGNYTEGVGLSMGIVGHDHRVDLQTAKPEFHGRDLGRGRVELRYYRCRYVLHDEEIGNVSDVVEVSCAP